jgi:hypothetical protein
MRLKNNEIKMTETMQYCEFANEVWKYTPYVIGAFAVGMIWTLVKAIKYSSPENQFKRKIKKMYQKNKNLIKISSGFNNTAKPSLYEILQNIDSETLIKIKNMPYNKLRRN